MEQTHLSQLMVAMVQFKPELAKSSPTDSYAPADQRPTSLYSRPSDGNAVSRNPSVGTRYSLAISGSANPDDFGDVDDDAEVPVGHTFTYIPPNPKKFYKRLLEICIDYDLKLMETLDKDQTVSLGILSSKSLDVLNECALRWRMMSSYRVSSFLDVIKYRYEREKVPYECIPDALQVIERTLQESNLDLWPKVDVCFFSIIGCRQPPDSLLIQSDYLATIYASLFNIFLSSLYHCLERLPGLKRDEIQPFVEILENVYETGLLERFQVDVASRIKDISERVQVCLFIF